MTTLNLQAIADVLLDFVVMADNEIIYLKTGRRYGLSMRDSIGQWESTIRDARSILNLLVTLDPETSIEILDTEC